MLLRDRRLRRRRAAHAHARPVAAPVSPYRLPTGKGIFVRALSHTGTPDQMVDRCRWAGLRWVAIQVMWQHPDHDKTLNLPEIATYAKALGVANIDVWVWGFPERASKRQLTFTQTLASAARSAGAAGVILDAEGPWIGASDHEAAALVTRMRAAAPGRKIGVTSYGNVLGFPDFPWEGFATADLGMPQVYHGHETLEIGDDYQAWAIGAYQGAGFSAVVPALAAYDVSPDELLEIYGRTPQPNGAVIWWDWYNATAHGTWGAIRDAGAFSLRRTADVDP